MTIRMMIEDVVCILGLLEIYLVIFSRFEKRVAVDHTHDLQNEVKGKYPK